MYLVTYQWIIFVIRRLRDKRVAMLVKLRLLGALLDIVRLVRSLLCLSFLHLLDSVTEGFFDQVKEDTLLLYPPASPRIRPEAEINSARMASMKITSRGLARCGIVS